jgi:hypothetical protein
VAALSLKSLAAYSHGCAVNTPTLDRPKVGFGGNAIGDRIPYIRLQHPISRGSLAKIHVPFMLTSYSLWHIGWGFPQR